MQLLLERWCERKEPGRNLQRIYPQHRVCFYTVKSVLKEKRHTIDPKDNHVQGRGR